MQQNYCQLLASISKSIVSKSNKPSLLQSVYKEVLPIFEIESIGMFIINEKENYHYDLTVVYPEIDNSNLNQELNDVIEDHKMAYHGTTVAYHFEQLKKKQQPIVFNFEKDFKKYPHPFSEVILAQGYTETYGALLQTGNEAFGVLYFNSKQTHTLKSVDASFYQQVADLTAIALANILAKEEILEREQEKIKLLEISVDLATTKNPSEIFSILLTKIKPLVNFDHIVIGILNKEKTFQIAYIANLDWDSETNHGNLDKLMEYQFPFDDWYKNIFSVNGGVILKIPEEYKKNKELPYLKLMHDAGIKETMFTLLQSFGGDIGGLYLHSNSENFFKPSQLPLLTSIANQIGIAFANILANEEILEREKEKTKLLAISEKLSSIRDKKGLFDAIFQQVSSIFNFDTATVAFYDATLEYTKHFQTAYDEDYRHNENYQVITGEKVPTKGNPHGEFIHYKTPQIISLDYFNDKYPGHVGVKIMNDFKLLECVILPLRYGDKLLATFEMHSKKKGTYSNKNIPLYENLANQLAVAVANIMANEEILEREKDKTILLEITELIAQVKNRDELLKLIVAKVKPIFNFHDCGLFIISKDGNTHSDLAAVLPDISVSDWNNYIKAVSSNMPHKNSPVEWMIEQIDYAAQPVLYDFKNLVEKFPDYPQLAGFDILEIGYRDCLSANLKVGGEIIGMFCINALSKNFFSPACFSIFQSVSDTIAIAMANILANEEIVEREKEKSILLSISQQISQIRDLDTLVNWLHIEANKLHQSQHVMIVLTSPKENTVQLILGEADAAWQQAAGMRPKKGLMNLPTPYKDSIFEHIELLPEGELYSAADFSFPETSNFCNTDFQLAESFYVKLIHKGEPIGHISFHTFTKGIFKNIDISLCKNFANQMAVSLINILSNEAILEREKQKTFEIKINNAVLKNDRFEDVLKEVTESIDKAVGCDICYIRIRSEEIDVKPFNLFCEKKGTDYLIKSRDGILNEMAVKHADIEKDISDFFATLEHPLILTGTALEEKQQQFNYLKAFKNTFHIQSFAFLPLYVKGKAKVQLIIGSKRAFAYIDNDLETIHQVIPQLSLTLDNRLAFMQIQKLKEILETENLYLQEEINDNYNFNEIIGSSNLLKKVFTQASMVAVTDTTILITGETGTGKELIARAIHNLSTRKDKIMVKVNCACLPAQLIESELFGHEKGAFTGAVEKRIGKFELANGGTIFLDEIGELPLELQAKLLRVIQEREFERIGGRTVLKTDIRIIAATNKDLELETREKRFRSDLYYRLNVFPIHLPALKERKEDIPLLALHFAKKFGQKMRKNISAITNDALQEMIHYDWPGNIRELEHVVEHSVISSKSSKLTLARPLLTTKTSSVKSLTEFRIKTLNDNEREYILSILKYCNGRVRGNGGAAQLLDIHPNTLESRMVKLGIRKEHVM